MRQRDWFLRVMVTLLVAGVWVLILRPVLAPTPAKAVEAQTVQDEVRAKRFVLVGGQGKERAVLGVTPDGDTAMTMFDKEGTALVKLGVATYSGPAQGSLQLLDGDGRARVKVAFTPTREAAFLGVPHKRGQPSVV